MKQNDKKIKYGSISLGISVELAYSQYKNRNGQEIRVDVRKKASFDVDPKYIKSECSHTGIFSKLLEFQNGANKILRLTRKLLMEGNYVEFCVSTHSYEDVPEYEAVASCGSYKSTLNPLYYNEWYYKGHGEDTDMSLEEGGLYLTPDTRYTEESHDMYIKWTDDIFSALGEAGI